MKNLNQPEKVAQQSKFKKLIASLISASLAIPFTLPAYAAEPAQTPPEISGVAADPNVMILFDVSGSMMFHYLPDAIGNIGAGNPVYHPKDPAYSNHTSYYYNHFVSTDKADGFAALMRSSTVSKLYYNPAVTYKPWKFPDGTSMKEHDPKVVPNYVSPNPKYPAVLIDLTEKEVAYDLSIATGKRVSFCELPTGSTSVFCNWDTSHPKIQFIRKVTPAIYFIYKGADAYPDAPAGTYYPKALPDPEFMYSSDKIKQFLDIANYEPVVIMDIDPIAGIQQRGTRTDCKKLNTGTPGPNDIISCTREEELQNFANWFAYYRDRKRVAAGALTHVLSKDYGMNYRLGWAQYSAREWNGNFDGLTIPYIKNGVRNADLAHKTAVFERLYDVEAGTLGGTSTRNALDAIGQYFSVTTNNGPWGNTPGDATDDSPKLSCRRSYTILMTDGGYNDVSTDSKNWDSVDGKTIVHANGVTKYKYTPAAPFKDAHAETLADIAFKYWVQDLQPNIPNDIPARDDPKLGQGAFWQNMVTHTIGFGLKGSYSKEKDEDKLLAGDLAWPAPNAGQGTGGVEGSPGRTDDLWHAAVNGHGKFFSASSVEPLMEAFSEIFDSMAGDAVAPPKTAILSNQMIEDNTLFSTTYSAGDWSGDLFSYKAGLVGNAITQNWSAAAQMPADSSRNIWIGSGKTNPTSSAPAALEFKWSSISGNAGLAAALVDEKLLNYIRGDKTEEDSKLYRARTRAPTGLSPLGDIVNSTPVIAHKAQSFDSSGYYYSAYLTAMKNRTPMVFVGANDGMLHAFNMNTGKETFAFIPNGVASKLPHLASENYNANHKYYVDGPLSLVDVFLDELVLECYKDTTGCHRNILLGTAGAGARSVFALDVTNPGRYTGADASSPVLWDLTPESDDMKDLGFVMQEMQYYKRNVDYGTNAEVALFGNGAYSHSGKAVLYAVDMRSGKQVAAISVAGGSKNGLMGVTIVGKGAYAGDLKGNLWYFDLSAKSPSSWTAKKIFTTKGNRPITQRPAYLAHPLGGNMVLFGTGKFFDEADGVSTETEAVYGIWDKDHSMVGNGQLITYETKKVTLGGGTFYTYENPPVMDWTKNKGWTVPLTMGSGQRSLFTPVMIGSNVGFATTLTQGGAGGSSCEAGSIGGIALAMNALSGGFPNIKWDTNSDGIIDDRDGNYIGFPADGGQAGHLLSDPGMLGGGKIPGGTGCEAGYVLEAWQGTPMCVKPRDTKALIQLF